MKLISYKFAEHYKFSDKANLIKKALSLMLFIAFGIVLKGQSNPNYLEKYWHYRERLNKFVYVSPDFDSAGTNLPVVVIDIYHSFLQWDDGNNDMKNYIAMLATEYRLLKDYDQDVDAAQTAKQLYYALKSFERLDRTAESYHRPGGAQFFWDKNGCFLRKDWTPEFWEKHRAGGTDTIFQFSVINCNEKNLHDRGKDSIIYMLNSIDNCWNFLEAFSLVHALVGEEMVDGSLIDFKQIAENNVRRIFNNMTHDEDRCLFPLHCQVPQPPAPPLPYNPELKTKWYLENPVTDKLVPLGNGITTTNESTGDIIKDGSSLIISYGFAKAANRILGYTDTPEPFNPDRFIPTPYSDIFFKKTLLLAQPINTYVEGRAVYEICPSLLGPFPNIGREVWLRNQVEGFAERILDFGPNPPLCEYIEDVYFPILPVILKIPGSDKGYKLRSLCATGNIPDANGKHPYDLLIEKQFLGDAIYPHEHLPLLWSVLNNDYSKISQNDRNFVLNLLEIAPPCGPNKICENDEPWNYITSRAIEWSSTNRLNNPQECGAATWGYGEYNGLDYMLLHNLFWLSNEPILDNISNYNYGIPYGPKPIAKTQIACSRILNLDNKEIVLTAGESILLNPGFEASGNGTFFANTGKVSQDNRPVLYQKVISNDYPECEFK